MNLSLSWLKDYITFDLSEHQIAEILTSIGLEVAGVEHYQSIKGGLEGLVVGHVLTCKPHDNSDHLNITTVDIGQGDPLQIVCGAPNVAQGQKVVVATIGTKLYNGQEEWKIKRSKIRGEESFGMICSESEIGLSESHSGIIVLPNDLPVGTLAKDYYKVETDTVIEIDITPNRSDAISHYGVARDLYAYCLAHGIEASLRRPSVELFEAKPSCKKEISVEVASSDKAPRYAGIVMTNVKVEESPKWLRSRLLSIGQRPINSVVDITNYLMHSFGQPLHAFDCEQIEGDKIVVRSAIQNETLTTLDEIERKLTDEDLVICDANKPMCLAGVFGGLNSGVTEKTTSIFIESAYFNPVSVRKSARYHGLNTDSSFRFERGVNPNDTIYVLKLASMMIKDIAHAQIASEITDIYPDKIEDFKVTLSLNKVNSLIGKNIDSRQIETILQGLEIDIISRREELNDKIYEIQVPAYRTDVRRDVDVIEDILRIYGYNNIDISNELKSNIIYRAKPDSNELQNIVSEHLTSNGFSEIMNNSLTKASYYDTLKTYPKEHNVRIINALSNDLGVMRQSLVFGGLEGIAYNINRKNTDIKFYEFGNCYEYDTGAVDEQEPLKKYNEEEHLGIWVTGKNHPISWLNKDSMSTIYDLKTHVENIFTRLRITNLSIKEFSNDIFSQGIEYQVNNDVVLAHIGIISKDILNMMGIKAEVFYADIFWNKLVKATGKKQMIFKEISKFPEVSRDLALLLDKDISFARIEEIAYQVEKRLLRKVSLFDVYEGKNIAEGKKSYAVNFILQDISKTLTDKQIDSVMNKIQGALKEKLGAELR